MKIANNISALRILNQIKNNTRKSSLSMGKLSSGLRINKAADDAAGLAISEKMRSQIRGLDQATRNAQDGISLIQTAEGGLSQIIDPPLQRLRELAIQAANDTLNSDDRIKIQEEIDQIKASIDSIAKKTTFNGIHLLSTGIEDTVRITSKTNASGGFRVEMSTALDSTPEDTAENVIRNFQKLKNGEIGDANPIDLAQHWTLSRPTSNTIKLENNSGHGFLLGHNSPDGNLAYSGDWSSSYTIVRLPDTTTEDYFGALSIVDNANPSEQRDDLIFSFFSPHSNELTLQIGANENSHFSIEMNDMTTSSIGIVNLSVLTVTDAQEAIQLIDQSLNMALTQRSKFGAYQNRLEYTINNLTSSAENLTASESQIRDVDMAKEIMNQTKNSILSQAAQAMLAQSNQMPQGVLQLLR